jgi:hypothetical protein
VDGAVLPVAVHSVPGATLSVKAPGSEVAPQPSALATTNDQAHFELRIMSTVPAEILLQVKAGPVPRSTTRIH